jgi:hypothetical protein
MAYPLGMAVVDPSHHLVGIQFDKDRGHRLLAPQVVFGHFIGCEWQTVHYNIQVNLVFFVPVRVERVLNIDAVAVVQFFQYLELSIFVSAVLKYFFNSHGLPRFHADRLQNDSKCAGIDNSKDIKGLVELKQIIRSNSYLSPLVNSGYNLLNLLFWD